MKYLQLALATIILGLLARFTPAHAGGIPGAGRTNAFPKAAAAGAKLDVKLWQWGDGDMRRVLTNLAEGARVPMSLFQTNRMSVRFVVPVDHDTIFCRFLTSDGPAESTYGPASTTNHQGDLAKREYRAFVEDYFWPMRAGSCCLEVKAWKSDKPVATLVMRFDLVDTAPVPNNTTFTKGRKDCFGNELTWSKPVQLKGLNETAKLQDNDYPFEPQRAYNTINYERFPAFSLPPRFSTIWHSRRFPEERQMGGPLNRGFKATAVVDNSQDANLGISQSVWWHTPDHQCMLINQWLQKDPERFHDLKGYAEHRSAFVSASNAFLLGYECYGGSLAGTYGWDEEQMWPTIAEKLVREFPEYVPADVLKLAGDDPKVEKDETKARLHDAYIKAWGDFIANTYLGAKARAAESGINLKIWHYGTKPPGGEVFHFNGADVDAATGRPKCESPGNLWRWFKEGGRDDGKIDFNGTLYSSTIEYWSKDFYYWTLLPEHATMYEKDAAGKYTLEADGRRKIRRDLFEEVFYKDPVKIGYDDPAVACMFLKKFIAMGEDSLYWFNGGKYYKDRGTLITSKQLMPAVRPGNQETWPGDTIQLGSRPISPFMAEAVPIFTFMMGLESFYLWDAGYPVGPLGFSTGGGESKQTLGELEFLLKGMHRVSQFNKLFEGAYSFIRPQRVVDTWNRDNALLIRGLVNGRYLVLAMSNPYLDPGETQDVEIWYDQPYAKRAQAVWRDKVTVKARKNHIFQCKLPPGAYDPDKLYFRFTLKDGDYTKTFTLSGNYDKPYALDKP